MKAWMLKADREYADELYNEVIFADTPQDAWKVFIARDLAPDDVEYEDGCLTHVEWADKYAPGPVPDIAWIHAGWGVECSGCFAMIYDGESFERDPDGEEIMFNPTAVGDRVYCTPECKESDERYTRFILRRRARLGRWLKRHLLERFPFVTPAEDTNYPQIAENGRLSYIEMSFTFPGDKYHGSYIRFTRGGGFSVYVSAGDLETFNAVRENFEKK